MGMEQIVPIAVFGAFAIGAFAVMNMFAVEKPRALERLEEYKNPIRRKRKEEDESAMKKQDAMTRMLAMASPALAAPLQPTNEKEANKLKQKLNEAGFRNEAAPAMFLSLKVGMLVIGLVFSGAGVMLFTEMSQKNIMAAVAVAGVMFYLPEVALHFIGKARKEQIFLGLPDALDLMVVCVEAGLGLDQALRKVAEEMKRSYKVISDEFNLANFQLQVGRPKAEVLHDLGDRSGVDDLRQLAAILIQADKFGSSVAQALRVQSESMRTRRRQLAEEKAAKTAVKLIFPLVIFIFPGIFVILVGPAAITMIRQMFPAMQG
ncbi:MAG: type II secretion system F family protein [Planctomycetaceae bacterium]|nr:type II secretion system F family protein [Planctomycetaceae bacterium]